MPLRPPIIITHSPSPSRIVSSVDASLASVIIQHDEPLRKEHVPKRKDISPGELL